MDTEYFFECPCCGKQTVAVGSGDISVDMVRCRECGNSYKAFYIGIVSEENRIPSSINANIMIERLYTTDETKFKKTWK